MIKLKCPRFATKDNDWLRKYALAARSASQFRLQCVWIRSLDVQIDVALRFYELLSTFGWALQSVGRLYQNTCGSTHEG